MPTLNDPALASAPVVAPDVEALNDGLAREHPIDAYYSTAPLPIRVIERRRLAIIKAMMGPCAGLSVLEVGSGGGHVLRMFPDAKLTAVDVSDVFLETAKKNLQGYDVAFIKGEIQRLALPSDHFDRVICTEVLEHTHHPEAIIADLARVLAPRGRAIITIPNDYLIDGLKSIVRSPALAWLVGKGIEWGGDHYHLHRWRQLEFRALLARYFDVVEMRSAPAQQIPIRVCFSCRKLGSG